MTTPLLKTQRALLSVSDKDGLVEFGQGLARLGIEIISTGGTFRTLTDAGVPARKVSDLTGFPEILDGRVKTLHPAIHGGILADRSRASHTAELREHDIGPIDLVVVNLYPFRETAARADRSESEIIEQIDIGGPCMVRAAAKNHLGVTVVVDPGDYSRVLADLGDNDLRVPEATRRQLAIKAFRHTQSYDAAVAGWLESRVSPEESTFPRKMSIDLRLIEEPRYGENPHQRAAVYQTVGGNGVFGGFEQLQGKQLSWNNVLDTDAARRLVAGFPDPTVVIVKHNNPCGVGCGETPAAAFRRARECDPVSAFGSIVAVNRPVDGEFSAAMSDLFVEVVVAPEITDEALGAFSAKKNLRVLRCPEFDATTSGVDMRSIDGGILAQTLDASTDSAAEWQCVTVAQPSEEDMVAAQLAWQVSRLVKSNAIVLANARQTVGIGAGQMSRVDSCRLAIDKAQLPIQGCAAASDAFFPFADGIEVLAEAGVRSIVQPGGSKRDSEVIETADRLGLVMLFSGRRHFKH